jgi:GNAT superfamily N-acetyltransferase
MSVTAIAYRRAQPRDVPALRSLHRASLGALGAAHYSPRQIAGMFLSEETVDPALIADGTFFVAESGGRLVGSGAWTLRRSAYEVRLPRSAVARPPESAAIRSVFVAPDRARRGIARALMDIVESDAVVRGGAVRLELLATLPSEPFYAALGYEPAGERIAAPLVNGAVFPALRMVKRILPEEPARLAA